MPEMTGNGLQVGFKFRSEVAFQLYPFQWGLYPLLLKKDHECEKAILIINSVTK
jgi:hypothetical protein